MRKTMGAWGPRPRKYPAPSGLAERSHAWKRERVIAVAARFLGYGYQHHHIPDWDPPVGWPWKTTCVGHNGRGVDCSNFTSFVYNQGFGLHMSSAIVRQSELKHATRGEESVPLERLALPHDYAERQKVLRTGDLLYIRGREAGPITHVVLWVGAVGRSPDDVPLILDSHGSGVKDEDGQAIPCGIRLRPFRKDSWYNRCASHAHRVWKA
jgi:cell wall-associated NlpC family hydrolase